MVSDDHFVGLLIRIEPDEPEIAGEDAKAAKLAAAMAAFDGFKDWARAARRAMLKSGLFWQGVIIGTLGGGIWGGLFAAASADWEKWDKVGNSGGWWGWWIFAVLLPGYFAGMAVVLAFIMLIWGAWIREHPAAVKTALPYLPMGLVAILWEGVLWLGRIFSHLPNFRGTHRPKQPRWHVPSSRNRWRGMRRAWQLAGALTDFVAAVGGFLFGGFLVRDNSLTGKWGMMGLALLAAGVWLGWDGVKKLRAWGQG